MPAWLFGLLFAALVVYTDDYVIAGVLPEIARDTDVSEAVAGQLVTAFSLTVALGAPTAAVLVAKWSRRRVFTTALVLFVLANACASLTSSFELLMVLRVVAALAAAMATPALFSVAALLAPEGRQGRYIATVALGVTGSIAVGVPIGTWIGGLWGWRTTFASMAVGGVLALVWLLGTLPKVGTVAAPNLRDQLRVLSSGPVLLGLCANTLMVTGSMMLLTYLAPYLAELSSADTAARAAIFSASGVAGMLGIWLGGVATDRWGVDRSLAAGIGAFLAVMVVFTALWPMRPISLWMVAPLAALWAGSVFWTSPAISARLLRLAGPVGPQALALNTSSAYLGVACSGALGGVLLAALGVSALPPASALLGIAALGVFAAAARVDRSAVAS